MQRVRTCKSAMYKLMLWSPTHCLGPILEKASLSILPPAMGDDMLDEMSESKLWVTRMLYWVFSSSERPSRLQEITNVHCVSGCSRASLGLNYYEREDTNGLMIYTLEYTSPAWGSTPGRWQHLHRQSWMAGLSAVMLCIRPSALALPDGPWRRQRIADALPPARFAGRPCRGGCHLGELRMPATCKVGDTHMGCQRSGDMLPCGRTSRHVVDERVPVDRFPV
jgi:hypothetical protein